MNRHAALDTYRCHGSFRRTGIGPVTSTRIAMS